VRLHGEPDRVSLIVSEDLIVSATVDTEGNSTPKNYQEWLDLLKKTPNKVGVLIKMFRVIHGNAPSEELEAKNLGGNMAGFLNYVRKDYGYAQRLIWDSATHSIPGRHLDYMRGMVRGRRNEPQRQRATSYSKVSDLRGES
jgi:hypothetical protein